MNNNDFEFLLKVNNKYIGRYGKCGAWHYQFNHNYKGMECNDKSIRANRLFFIALFDSIAMCK